MSGGGHTDRKLLIVDDDRSLRTILGWGFEDMGYRVWTAADCREAMTTAARVAFDCALLDYRLPDGNGHRLSSELQRRQPGLMVVLMSADRGAAVAEINDEPAAAAFVEKPVLPTRLDAFFNRHDGVLAGLA